MEKPTQGTSDRGKNKRYWNKQEISALLDFMADLKEDPQWRCEGGFKVGFTSVLEKKLNEKFPTSGIKAIPHIESKIKWLKEKYALITEMLRLSGFKWDDENNMIQCEKQAFDEFCEGRLKANGLWRMEFPHLPKLDIIFGVDRAKGTEVEDIDDAINDLDSDVNLATEEEVEDLTRLPNLPPSKKLKTRRASSGSSGKDDLTDKWASTMNDMNAHLDKIASSMVAVEEREQAAEARKQVVQAREIEVTKQKTQLLSEIAKIDGLSMENAIDAARILSSNPNELDIFYSCPDDKWKKSYILKIIGA